MKYDGYSMQYEMRYELSENWDALRGGVRARSITYTVRGLRFTALQNSVVVMHLRVPLWRTVRNYNST